MSKASSIAFGMGTMLVGACLSLFLGAGSAITGLIIGVGLMIYGISSSSEETEDSQFFANLHHHQTRVRAVLSARFLRANLMPRDAFQDFTLQICQAIGKANPEIIADLLCEIFVVNTSDLPITIRTITAESLLNGVWTELKRIDDLSYYQLQCEESSEVLGMPGVRNIKTTTKDLKSLSGIIDGPPLVKGVHQRGWLRFELATDAETVQEKIMSRVTIVDSLEGIHTVTPSDPPESDGWRVVHNPAKVFDS